MSRTIHGLSHKGLKFLRTKPASMPVYWIYVSRMNNEGVAWPSARGLAKDTGWNKTTCLEARDYLIEIKALEPVKEYIRPEWRKLTPQEQTRHKNFDRSEYYRPTGHIVINGTKYLMLYNGSDEASDIDNNSSDVPQRRTSDGAGHPPAPDVHSGSTELDSHFELGSSNTKPDSKKKKTITPNGGDTKDSKKKGKSDANLKIDAIIEAYIKGLTTPPAANQYGNPNRPQAKSLFEAGFTPDQVMEYTQVVQHQPYWNGKKPALRNIAEGIAAYFASKPPTVVPDHPMQPDNNAADDSPPATPEQIEAAKAQFFALVNSKSANEKQPIKESHNG